MEIILQRKPSGFRATIGELTVDGTFECFTLEDVVRELGPDGAGKIQNETAIQAGRYKVIIDFSQRFQKPMLHVLDVPFFTGIRIHSGNTDQNTEGCVLVGSQWVGEDLITGGSHELPNLMARIQQQLDSGHEVWIWIKAAPAALHQDRRRAEEGPGSLDRDS